MPRVKHVKHNHQRNIFVIIKNVNKKTKKSLVYHNSTALCQSRKTALHAKEKFWVLFYVLPFYREEKWKEIGRIARWQMPKAASTLPWEISLWKRSLFFTVKPAVPAALIMKTEVFENALQREEFQNPGFKSVEYWGFSKVMATRLSCAFKTEVPSNDRWLLLFQFLQRTSVNGGGLCVFKFPRPAISA